MALPIRNSRIRLAQGLTFWLEVGQGTPIVFLHGSWQDSSQWLPVIEQLSHDFHCLAPDLMGFGESETPDVHYSIAFEAECLAEFLTTLKLQRVYLVAHSLGGWVAASYALKHLEQVAGLVLIAPEGLQLRENRDRWSKERFLLAPLTSWILKLLLPISKLFKQRRMQQLLQERQELRRSLIACKLLFYRRRSEIRAESLNDRLQWLKVPLMILQGDQESAIAASLNHEYVRLAPQAEMEIIPQAGQDVLATSPELVAQRIREFVRRG